MLMYKLLNRDMTSYGGMKWEIGKTNEAIGKGNEMCTNAVLHCYAHPVLALLFNPIHANICNPRLFSIECSTIVANDGLKFACKKQTPKQELIPFDLKTEDRVEFAIRVAMKIYPYKTFNQWAINWLNKTNRSGEAARAASEAINAARAASEAASEAANAASWAISAASWAASWAISAASWAAKASSEAASEAARAINAANATLILESLQECSFYISENEI